MVNRFFVRFRQYIEKNDLRSIGNFQECGGILMFIMNKTVKDWKCRIHIIFPEQQYVNICIEFCDITNEKRSKAVFEALNYLNSLALFERYYMNDTGLICEVNFLPETINFDWKVVFNVIETIIQNANILTYDLISHAIDCWDKNNMQHQKHNFDNSEPEEYEPEEYETYNDEDYRFSRRELAEYYGYQEDDDYSYEQFLDDL